MKGTCDRAVDVTTDIRIAKTATNADSLNVDKAIVYIATAVATDARIAGIATGTAFFDVDKAIVYIGGLHENHFSPHFKEV